MKITYAGTLKELGQITRVLRSVHKGQRVFIRIDGANVLVEVAGATPRPSASADVHESLEDALLRQVA
jgi:hypothetical protein